MAQGDKAKGLNKNKRAFVKKVKPTRGDQQKLKVGRIFLPTKKIDKVAVAQSELQHQKKLSKFTEAVFANRVKGVSGSDLTMQYEALTEKNKKKGHK